MSSGLVFLRTYGLLGATCGGKWLAMVTWNPDHRGKRNLKIDRAPLETIGAKFHLWSYWDEKYLGVQDATYEFPDVEHYHSKLLRLTPVGDGQSPTLIGSNLHMAMGSTEILDLKTNSKGATIELEPSAGALEGQLVFHSTERLKVAKAEGCQAFVMQSDQGENVYTVVITDRQRDTPQRIQLVGTKALVPRLADIKNDSTLKKKWEAGTMTVVTGGIK